MPAHDNYLNEKLCETNREKKTAHSCTMLNKFGAPFFLFYYHRQSTDTFIGMHELCSTIRTIVIKYLFSDQFSGISIATFEYNRFMERAKLSRKSAAKTKKNETK